MIVCDKIPSMKEFRYKGIFSFSSQAFIGHLEEYFAKNSEKYVVHITSPRLPRTYNIVRLYKRGKLVEEKKLWSHHNIFLYFLIWYIQHIYCLFHYFKPNERFFAIVFMPHLFFLSSIQKLFRRVEYVFFIGDYCPDPNPLIRLYEWMRKYYHGQLKYACYLSDTLNKIMNGRIIHTHSKKTIMWGLKAKNIKRIHSIKKFPILFVGLVKDSQGLDFFFTFLKKRPKYFLNILGKCDQDLYNKYITRVKKLGIEKQVYFPNKFFSDEEVENISKTCKVGLALYDTSKQNMTYYTEPGKIKFYAELGLPVIMSDTSSIKEYVKKFHTGEIVKRNNKSVGQALVKISKKYGEYSEGLKKFNAYFSYEKYYRTKFTFLETK